MLFKNLGRGIVRGRQIVRAASVLIFDFCEPRGLDSVPRMIQVLEGKNKVWFGLSSMIQWRPPRNGRPQHFSALVADNVGAGNEKFFLHSDGKPPTEETIGLDAEIRSVSHLVYQRLLDMPMEMMDVPEDDEASGGS
jgi:hypothetical protein